MVQNTQTRGLPTPESLRTLRPSEGKDLILAPSQSPSLQVSHKRDQISRDLTVRPKIRLSRPLSPDSPHVKD